MCLVGVVVRRYIDFLILLIPTPLVSALFCSSILTFCSFLKMFFVLVPVHFCNLNFVSYSINKHTCDYGRPTEAVREEAHTNVRFISCDGHQLYDFKERGVDLEAEGEVEGVRYIEMHRGPHTYWARLLQGPEISN